MNLGRAALVLTAAELSIARFYVPTVGHSWPMVFVAAAHIFVGVMGCLLVQRRGNRSVFCAIVLLIPAGWLWWPLGWLCLAVPTAIETGLFFLH